MTRSINPTHYLIYPFIIFVTGCTQQSPSHVAISETPPIVQSLHNRPFYSHAAHPSQILKKPAHTTQKSAREARIEHNTVWDRLISLYSLPEIENPRVDQQLQWYLQHPDYINRIQQRAEPYLYFILNEVEAKEIPGELALLPAVESAFKPQAYSSSHAAGLWQFIPSTGRLFGLKQNWWYDGRRDIVASTRAATRYLKELGEEFDDDWLLALASYNGGKGNIRKAMQKNSDQELETDYWSLDLRQETMDYVPRLLAIAKIFAHPEQYNISLRDYPNEPFFEVVDIQSQLDLSKAVELAQTDSNDFFLLNPAFNRWSTAPDGPHRLLIPVDKANHFKNKLARLPKKERMGWIQHKIQPGENLSIIAKKHNASIQAIKQTNQLHSNIIKAGKVLLIPVSDRSLASHLPNSPKTSRVYTVRKGDTFWLIARKFSINSKDLARWNRLSLNTPLHPGQKLIIKHSEISAVAVRRLPLHGG